LSIFTKIFVVLTMVMAVLLLALVVPFVMNTNTYRGDYTRVKNQLQIAEANAARAENDILAARQAAASEAATLNATIARLEGEVQKRDKDIQDAQGQLIALQNANADVRAELGRLSAGLQQQTQINGMLQEEIKTRRENSLKLETRAIELSEQLRDKTTQADTLIREVRLIKEQMADLEAQNREMANQVQSGGAKPGSSPSMATTGGVNAGFNASVAVRGLVTDVQKIGDQTFVAINVGSNDQVCEGMRFMVHKGDQFLGNVVITKVDLNSAAGRVTLAKGDIKANDEVLSGGL
jgi:hypothetical protein